MIDVWKKAKQNIEVFVLKSGVFWKCVSALSHS